jgi:hypothetical protein
MQKEMDRDYYRALPTHQLVELGKTSKSELLIAIAERLEDRTHRNEGVPKPYMRRPGDSRHAY